MLNVNKLYHNNRDKVCGSKVHRRVLASFRVESIKTEYKDIIVWELEQTTRRTNNIYGHWFNMHTKSYI